jgi:hypothetical protein
MDTTSDLSPIMRRAAARTVARAMTQQDLERLTARPNTRAGGTALSGLRLSYPRRPSFTRTRASLAGLLVVLAGLFSAAAWVGRPATGAPAPLGLDVRGLEMTRSGHLPLFEDQYQRHYGVLGTLKE